MAVICLVTTGQPSTNPRLVKEADALVEAGHRVSVVCAHWAQWADDTDRELLASRRLSCTYVGGHGRHSPRYQWTRVRHRVARELFRRGLTSTISPDALSRVTPELRHAAKKTRADLYIAHNLGALPAAYAAARAHSAKLGFDAEDFHSADWSATNWPARIARNVERALVPECDYVTAAAPLIAERYAEVCGMPAPTVIRNVFPLEERPAEFRPTRPGPLTLYWFSQTIGCGRGLEDVVDSMAQIGRPDVVLHLQGTWQAGYEEAIRRRVLELGLGSQQLAYHQPAASGAMVSRASQFDIGLAVETGRDENNRIIQTNKLFTYILAGAALLATNTPGQAPLVESLGSAARMYTPGDVPALTAHLRTWHDDRALLDAARRSAWQAGESTYNWNREKAVFLDEVHRVLQNRLAAVASGSRATRLGKSRVETLSQDIQ